MNKFSILTVVLLVSVLSIFQCNAQNRWKLNENGSITWKIDTRLPHDDHIEMSGKKVSVVVRYGVDTEGAFNLSRTIVWPMLRTIPNNTHASLMRIFNCDLIKMINLNGHPMSSEKVNSISLNGLITIKSALSLADKKNSTSLELTRTLFPTVALPSYCENYSIKNISNSTITIEIPDFKVVYTTDSTAGIDGSYVLSVSTINSGGIKLVPGASHSFGLTFSGHKKGEQFLEINPETELSNRLQLLNYLTDNLIFESPDSVLNTLFAFAKIRTSESIFDTKGGLMHGPGGEAYYAAIWANDQAEYVGPFFPYLGYETGNLSSLNTYRHFARFMNPDYKPIPSSIIAEGPDIWNGAGDRGDGAMIAYGAARYALARGDIKEATELWKLIEWCLEFCKRKLNAEGVVSSDSDELENRFPSGKANLCTSSLYYDALNSAVYLGKELGKPIEQLAEYAKQAKTLKTNIEKYFGATLNGFDTYRYYDGNTVLRSWICVPLTVNIFDRKTGTIDALFSPILWTPDGLSTQAGDNTFWDRSTLYTLRGVFAAGETSKALDHLIYYSNRRLLGEHVPYPVEAYPEGNQRHLAAESGLYCRIFTEGIFGIRPTGLHSFTFSPRLPKEWNHMALREIHAFDTSFDIEVVRKANKLEVTVKTNSKIILKKDINEGALLNIKFPFDK